MEDELAVSIGRNELEVGEGWKRKTRKTKQYKKKIHNRIWVNFVRFLQRERFLGFPANLGAETIR